MRRWAGAPILAIALALAPVVTGAPQGQAGAQTPAPVPSQLPVTGILTIDPERLFEETAFGQRVQRDLERRAAGLAAENRRIEGELIAEERDLTERRAGLATEEFRALADAFDEKVNRIRAEQDAKADALQNFRDRERQRFFGQIGGVLAAILAERQAVIVLDRRNVVLSAEAIDVTNDLIRRIDAAIGDGSGPPAPEAPAPDVQVEAPDETAPEDPPADDSATGAN